MSGSVQNLSHIRSGDGFGLHDLRLIERPHVHVAFGRPCRAGDVSQPRGGEVETRLAVRECANNASAPTDLSHDPFERIVNRYEDHGAPLVRLGLFGPGVWCDHPGQGAPGARQWAGRSVR